MKRVGLIGLGNLGSAIGANLIGAGHEVIGYRRSSMKAFVAMGGVAGKSPKDVAERADVVLVCLPSVDALHEVYSGPEGILKSGRDGLDTFELSTISLKAKVEECALANAHGVTMVDCTISGNPTYIAARNAAIFAGGDHDAFDRWVTVLRDITDKVTWMGAFGTGRLAKFVALYLVATHTMAAAEAFQLATRAGLDRGAMFEAIKGSNATSAMFESRGELMVGRDYAGYDSGKRRQNKTREESGQLPNRGMANRSKSVGKLSGLAHGLGGVYPILDAMNKAYADATQSGAGVYDIAEVFEFFMVDGEASPNMDAVMDLLDKFD